MASRPPPSIDIYSGAFDPREALAAEELPLPLPYVDVAPLNNLAECRRLLDPDHPEAILPPPPGRPLTRPPSQGAGRRPATSQPLAPGPGPGAGGLTGPLALLHNLLRRRVSVVTRLESSVRGTTTGLLLAADKHFNMLLVDAVDTAWGGTAPDSLPAKGGQTLIRGECVVLVYEAQAAAGLTSKEQPGMLNAGAARDMRRGERLGSDPPASRGEVRLNRGDRRASSSRARWTGQQR